MPRCDWCQNEQDLKQVGTEYSGHAILVCPCGHEWVDSSKVVDQKKADSFWEGFMGLVKSFKKGL